jgi:hypothetical protein
MFKFLKDGENSLMVVLVLVKINRLNIDVMKKLKNEIKNKAVIYHTGQFILRGHVILV